MRKLKKLLTIGFLLFGVSLSLWNCQKEVIDIDVEKESEYHFNYLSLDEVIKKEGLDNSIQLIESYFDINKTS